MGLAKELGHLTDDITIFRETVVGNVNGAEIKKWVGTVSKGLYKDDTSVQFSNTKEEVKSIGHFKIQEFLELRDGEEERICLGSYPGENDSLPTFAREIIRIKDLRRLLEKKNGLPATEWKVWVK